MKGIFIAAGVLVVLVVAGHTYMQHQMFKDKGRLVAVAFGAPGKDTIQMHVGISDLMTMRDPPKTTPKGAVLWRDWIKEHWELRKAAGEKVVLQRLGTSALMQNAAAAGSPKFCLTAELEKGVDYEFDFIPILDEGKLYRYEFTAPSEPKAPWRMTFAPVDNEEE